MKEKVEAALDETIAVHKQLKAQSETIADVGCRLAEVLAAGGSIYVIGNGGSAADSQHMAGELVGRFLLEQRKPLRCSALTTDTSVLTSIGNDFGFDQVFVKQVEAFVKKGDALVAISTSGNSPNVIRAAEKALELGALVVALLGRDGGILASKCHKSIIVPAQTSPRIQEGHATIIHILCDVIEQHLSELAKPSYQC